MKLKQEAEKPAFVTDAHLGWVAKHLRFAGYDTLFLPERGGRELLETAEGESRILLSRSGRLPASPHLYSVREKEGKELLAELAERFALKKYYAPFSRCMVCNTPLEPSTPPASLPRSYQNRFREFRRCPGCGRVYWRGDHYRNMDRLWQELFRLID
jgi:uncharacterized protein with PIN domain